MNKNNKNKAKGETAEAAFLCKAIRMNLGVSSPWGDNKKYDFIIEGYTGKLYKVQVKSTENFIKSKKGGMYRIKAGFGIKRKGYKKNDVAFIICYVVPSDNFYLIPFMALKGTSIQLYPHRDNPAGFYERYKEAWDLIK